MVVDEDLEPRPPRAGDSDTVSQLGPLLDRLGGTPAIIDDTAWTFPSLMKRTLEPILDAARGVLGDDADEVLVVAPSRWPRRQTTALRLALHTALGREVRIVSADRALAHTISTPAPGATAIVIDAGAAALSAVAVAAGPRYPRVIGRHSVDGGGDSFDRILMANAITAAGHPEVALATRMAWIGVPRIRAARHELADRDQIEVKLPRPVDRIELSAEDVDHAGALYFEMKLADLFTPLIAALEGQQLCAVVVCGGLSSDPALYGAIKEITGAPVKAMPDPVHAVCRGALRAAATRTDPVAESSHRLRAAAATSRPHRWLIYTCAATAVTTIVVASAMVWPARPVPQAAEWRSEQAARAAIAVLPGSGTVDELYLKQWTDDAADSDHTLLRGQGEALTLACGGDHTAEDPEKAAVRWQAARVFVSSPTAAAPSPRGQFDWARAGTSVIVDATVLTRSSAETLWRQVEQANRTCPSTRQNVVRNVVPIPADGTDPGPPRFAQSTTEAASGGDAALNSRIAVGPKRLAWRGLMSATQTGSGSGWNVTCIAAIDDVVIRRACAAAKASPQADQLALAAMVAFNPIPADL
ncbi:hypothetical protein [Nocardia sp. NPDC052566]|uniref:hypothetical protein n=1 Tax=Nocardia sp. NPDC052566 TaxID=3364330 RepID=UPI0037C95117